MKPNAIIFIIPFLCGPWFLFIFLSLTCDFSKLYFFSKNTDHFLESFEIYEKSSLQALNDFEAWLDQNLNNQKIFSKSTANTQHNVCIGILTKKRSSEHSYTTQTVTSLITRIQLKYQNEVEITLFNTDDEVNRKNNSEFNRLKKFLNYENIPSPSFVNNAEMSRLLKYTIKLKESMDYSYVMNRFYSNSQCKYGLIIEDDIITTFDWYSQLKNTLQNLEAHQCDWMMLKLFISYRNFEWLLLPYRWIVTVFQAIIIALIEYKIFSFFIETRKVNRRFLILILFVNTIILLAWLNCYSVRPLGNGLINYAQGFNTVANVYPREKLKLLSNHLNKTNRQYLESGKNFKPKDIAIEEFRRSSSSLWWFNGFKYKLNNEYIVEPTVVQHIGIYSSLSNDQSDINSQSLLKLQYRPFQSYSFRSHREPIQFDPQWFLS
jgi:hypothetical protein